MWLPPGHWRRLPSGEYLQGGRWMAVYGTLEEVPVFAEFGRIVPVASSAGCRSGIANSLAAMADDAHYDADAGLEHPAHLDVTVIAGDDGAFQLIEDDGSGGSDPLRTDAGVRAAAARLVVGGGGLRFPGVGVTGARRTAAVAGAAPVRHSPGRRAQRAGHGCGRVHPGGVSTGGDAVVRVAGAAAGVALYGAGARGGVGGASRSARRETHRPPAGDAVGQLVQDGAARGDGGAVGRQPHAQSGAGANRVAVAVRRRWWCGYVDVATDSQHLRDRLRVRGGVVAPGISSRMAATTAGGGVESALLSPLCVADADARRLASREVAGGAADVARQERDPG
eukprot:ctg_3060.g473